MKTNLTKFKKTALLGSLALCLAAGVSAQVPTDLSATEVKPSDDTRKVLPKAASSQDRATDKKDRPSDPGASNYVPGDLANPPLNPKENQNPSESNKKTGTAPAEKPAGATAPENSEAKGGNAAPARGGISPQESARQESLDPKKTEPQKKGKKETAKPQ